MRLTTRHGIFGHALRYEEDGIDLASHHSLARIREVVEVSDDVGLLHCIHRSDESARHLRIVLIHDGSRQVGRQTLPHQCREEKDTDQRRYQQAEQKHWPTQIRLNFA